MPPNTANPRLPLADKVAVVSGSSSGIGAAIARELSVRGANVVINYPFEAERANAASVQESLERPGKSIIVEADLSTTTGASVLVDAAVAEFGRIDILVNNAGLSGMMSMSEEDNDAFLAHWEKIVNLNGRGTLLLTRAALKHLSPNNSRIVNICSSTSRDPEHDMPIYAGSKGMIESFTRCWARELPRKYGCTINAVAPGPTATPALLAAPPEVLAQIKGTCERTPVAARLAEPKEIAWAVAMLCEEGASWMNGLYVPVTGGLTMN